MKKVMTMMGCVCVLLLLCGSAAADTYDFLQDWEGDGVQPDGTWSYKYSYNSNHDNYSDLDWYSSGGYWRKSNVSACIRSDRIRANGYYWIDLKWTAPEDGTVSYHVAGDVSGGVDMDYEIVKGTTILQSGTWAVDTSIDVLIEDISVVAGDELYLRVNTYNHGTGSNVALMFSTMQVTPEPATLALLGVGGLWSLLRRRR